MATVGSLKSHLLFGWLSEDGEKTKVGPDAPRGGARGRENNPFNGFSPFITRRASQAVAKTPVQASAAWPYCSAALGPRGLYDTGAMRTGELDALPPSDDRGSNASTAVWVVFFTARFALRNARLTSRSSDLFLSATSFVDDEDEDGVARSPGTPPVTYLRT